MTVMDRIRSAGLLGSERTRFHAEHPRSLAVNEGADHLFGRMPMTWMTQRSGGFLLALDPAGGNRITDVDGLTYIDFALGDTGAMAGHSPEPTVRAATQRMSTLGGISTMLPTEDAEWVGEKLTRRFGLTQWSFTLTATDANRWAIRLARLATGKSKLLVFSYCYHGSVDETFVIVGPGGQPVSRPGNVAPGVDPTETTRVVEWNDLAAVERELAHGDVAAIPTVGPWQSGGKPRPPSRVGTHPA
jgi:glutamate-1-semialdehyde 2,1-aminomutase